MDKNRRLNKLWGWVLKKNIHKWVVRAFIWHLRVLKVAWSEVVAWIYLSIYRNIHGYIYPGMYWMCRRCNEKLESQVWISVWFIMFKYPWESYESISSPIYGLNSRACVWKNNIHSQKKEWFYTPKIFWLSIAHKRLISCKKNNWINQSIQSCLSTVYNWSLFCFVFLIFFQGLIGYWEFSEISNSSPTH